MTGAACPRVSLETFAFSLKSQGQPWAGVDGIRMVPWAVQGSVPTRTTTHIYIYIYNYFTYIPNGTYLYVWWNWWRNNTAYAIIGPTLRKHLHFFESQVQTRHDFHAFQKRVILLWMEEILHQLIDGLSRCNPIMHSSVSELPIVTNCCRTFFHYGRVWKCGISSKLAIGGT
jgi:hypothetical protein